MRITILDADQGINVFGLGVKVRMDLTSANDDGGIRYQNRQYVWDIEPSYEGEFTIKSKDGIVKKCHAEFNMKFMQKWHAAINFEAKSLLNDSLMKYYQSH